MSQRRSADRTGQADVVRPRAEMLRQGSMGGSDLGCENSFYKDTGGVSQNNRQAGFRPAYRNISSGQTVLSCFADGEPAPVHVLDGVPDDWVVTRDQDGHVSRVLATVVSGFVRRGSFYTREAAARTCADENLRRNQDMLQSRY